ncbi:MAG: adenylate/guanylate cyclase domain-containing protein [Cytophagales bacterium]|nr:adenylate/guanylate cyclase domain-containing protein [Cytophagales bacterium]
MARNGNSLNLQALRILSIWTIAGLLMFFFEIVFRLSFDVREGVFFSVLTNVLPPVVFGYPFAVIELKLQGRKSVFSFGGMIAFRGLIYLCGIFLSYSVTKMVILAFDNNAFLGNYFELRFTILWGVFLVVFLVISSIIHHFDQQQLLSWLHGKYHQPVQEERIFLFLDINDSTKIAERIGSGRYFRFLDDFHSIVEKSISKYHGELFQYVGDEVVISWKARKGILRPNSIELFFEITTILRQRAGLFMDKYGYAPSVKGAVHIGEVTKGVLGKKKKDFAFAGDVLNSTARMYKICKQEDVPLVISQDLLVRFDSLKKYNPCPYGYFEPRGKEDKIFIYSLSQSLSYK